MLFMSYIALLEDTAMVEPLGKIPGFCCRARAPKIVPKIFKRGGSMESLRCCCCCCLNSSGPVDEFHES